MRVVTTLEIGSTITKANAFSLEDGRFRHIGQGFAPTSVAQGDVKIGVDAAIDEMRKTSGIEIDTTQVFVNSSAAGGLKMSVHGLTQGMTARAARARLRRAWHGRAPDAPASRRPRPPCPAPGRRTRRAAPR